MRRGRKTIGEVLRGILLATQFVGASACCLNEIDGLALDAGTDGGIDAGHDAGIDAGTDAGLGGCNPLFLDVPDGGFPDGGCLEVCDAHQTGTSQCRVDSLNPSVFCCCCAVGSCCATGRRPATLLAAGEHRPATVLGRYFRDAARLEAASVEAFRLLGRELRAHGAPRSLLARARRAARDEMRHALVTAALARRFGAEPVNPAYGAPPTVRSLEAIATENAIEGCARETYGALVALWQAKHARDAVVARAMRAIATDEVRHAELSWDVARWAEPVLSHRAQARIEKARAKAFVDLAHEVARPTPASLIASAGLPPPAVALALVRRVRSAVD